MKTLQKVTTVIVFSSLFGLLIPDLSAANPKPDQEGIDFFEKKIRPVLIAHCYECHSAETKNLKGSLLLDTRHDTLKGGGFRTLACSGETGRKYVARIAALRRRELSDAAEG